MKQPKLAGLVGGFNGFSGRLDKKKRGLRRASKRCEIHTEGTERGFLPPLPLGKAAIDSTGVVMCQVRRES